MFQIPEFEQSEQEDSSPAERGLGPSPSGEQPPGLNKHWGTVAGLLGEADHQQGQPASSSHHGGRHPPPPSHLPVRFASLAACTSASSTLTGGALSQSLTSLDLSFPLCQTEQ